MVKKLKLQNKKEVLYLTNQADHEIRALKVSHNSEFDEYKQKEVDNIDNIHEFIKNLQIELDSEKSINDSLLKSFELINEVITSIFNKFSQEEDLEFSHKRLEIMNAYKDYNNAELVIQAVFLDHLIQKLGSDNNWLIERLGELQKDNENLKNSGEMYANMKNNFINTSQVFKEFADARDKLRNQFETSIIEQANSQKPENTFKKLFQKYMKPNN